MKTWQNVAAAIAASTFLALGAGCATENHRGVKDTSAVVSDSWITTKVKSDLAVEKDVSATSITVNTYEGVVTLTGTVKSRTESQKAERIAREIQGVKSVVNKLQVQS